MPKVVQPDRRHPVPLNGRQEQPRDPLGVEIRPGRLDGSEPYSVSGEHEAAFWGVGPAWTSRQALGSLASLPRLESGDRGRV